MQLKITRRAVLLGGAAWAWAGASAQPAPWPATAGTVLRFAEVDEARHLLAADDEWMRAASGLQRRLIMGRSEPVTLDAFKRWNADAVRPWAAEMRERWARALEQVAPQWQALRIPLPREVLLIASNGQDSAGAPYTRGNGVVMPDLDKASIDSDAMVMAHELWHVASRHAPPLATRLYAEIGFEPMPALAFPEAWAPIRLANPDAPENRHAMRLSIGDREALVTPVLVAARTELQPGETFFNVVDVRLLEVQPDGTVSRAAMRDGQPVWHRVNDAHDYLRRLGGNTGYVIHPEETMADNVALLLTQGPARNADLLARLRAVFESQPR
jgi:hypothetical protein